MTRVDLPMETLILCVLVAVLSVISCRTEGIRASKEEELELERQLNVLNKPPTRSFKKGDGSIIDCIDIYKQPAFDHPLLRNHTIQLRPSSRPRGMVATELGSVKTSFRSGVQCPSGTVPIRRATKGDLIRATTISRLLHPSPTHSFVSNREGHYYAIAGTAPFDTSKQYYGLQGSVSIHNENVSPNQFSAAGVWLANGLAADSIHYGWTVNPGLYGDHKTRTFSYWNANNTGCFNVLCPGFVQVSPKHHLGEEILHQSTYKGDQSVQQIVVYKDEKTGNWWVEETIDGDGQVQIGYWPKALFTSLAESATLLQFGGEVYTASDEPLPAMGSGHFEPPDFRKTGFVSHIQYIDKALQPQDPEVNAFADLPDCYQVKVLGNTGKQYGFAVLFGGPGGSSCQGRNMK